jgi:hypothetical protein
VARDDRARHSAQAGGFFVRQNPSTYAFATKQR